MFNQQLADATRHANLEKIRELIYNCDFANFKSATDRGRTVLHLIAEKGHLDIVEYLVDKKKADFNIKDNDGRTPLHFAASNGRLEIVQYLIDKKKADFTVKSNFGKTPLYKAISVG
ncbi:ankyrin repeat domain-containing protein [Wolbachia endosymbiont of Tettigetta isshikii]|uniref:ankyrin repeat domain-containing protein n=1 Tax=Wolbachia endosymbiont of Tettigetta isshikii TaxID=3239093 RepID=UPI00397EB8DB